LDRRLVHDLLYLAALIASAALFYVIGFVILPLAFAFLAVFVVLAWFRIDLSLLAVVVFLPYFMAPVRFDDHPWPPSEWLMIGVGLAAVAIVASSLLGWTADGGDVSSLGVWRRPSRPNWAQLRASPFILPAFIFVLAAFTSAATADVKTLAFRDLIEVVLEPICFFGLLLLFTPLGDADRRERSFLLIGISVVVAGLVPSFIGLGQLITGQHLVAVTGAGYERIIGPYAGPDNFGLLLDRTIPMALALLLVRPIFLRKSEYSHPTGRQRLGAYRGTFVLALVLMLTALIFTFVLGAWLGSAIAVVMVLLVRFRHGWWLVAAATFVLVIGVALGGGKAHSITEGKRLLIWQSAIHMIQANPILGIGMDNFQHWYAPRAGDGVGLNARDQSGRCQHGLGYIDNSSKDALSEPCFSHPHNLVLDFWLSTGIVGLAAFLWLQFVFWSVLWRARNVLSLSPALLGAGGAMLAGLLHGMVDNAYFLVDLSSLMWLLFALASMCSCAMIEPTSGLVASRDSAYITPS
jgi:putative inorganic carbon (HCO3(-)) transporter